MEKYRKILWINVVIYFVGMVCDWLGGFVENIVLNVIGWTLSAISVGILCYVFIMLKKEGNLKKDNQGEISKAVKILMAVVAVLAIAELVAIILFVIKFS